VSEYCLLSILFPDTFFFIYYFFLLNTSLSISINGGGTSGRFPRGGSLRQLTDPLPRVMIFNPFRVLILLPCFQPQFFNQRKTIVVMFHELQTLHSSPLVANEGYVSFLPSFIFYLFTFILQKKRPRIPGPF
jgi:hypothetical protein